MIILKFCYVILNLNYTKAGDMTHQKIFNWQFQANNHINFNFYEFLYSNYAFKTEDDKWVHKSWWRQVFKTDFVDPFLGKEVTNFRKKFFRHIFNDKSTHMLSIPIHLFLWDTPRKNMVMSIFPNFEEVEGRKITLKKIQRRKFFFFCVPSKAS